MLFSAYRFGWCISETFIDVDIGVLDEPLLLENLVIHRYAVDHEHFNLSFDDFLFSILVGKRQLLLILI